MAICIGRKDGTVCHIDLWLMSCRVLKRDMEFAMMDVLADKCKKDGLTEIKGYYYPTEKNSMVKDFYSTMGFEKETESEEGSLWRLSLNGTYHRKNRHIQVEVKR